MDRAANPDRDGDRRLNRRRFLRYTTTAGALAAGSPALTALAGGNAAMAEAAGMAAPRVPSFKWEEATIAELQAAMGAGTLTSRRSARPGAPRQRPERAAARHPRSRQGQLRHR